MTVRKNKTTGKWEFDLSRGQDPVTGKRKRYTKRGFKTRREAKEAEEHFLLNQLGETTSTQKASISMLYQLMLVDDKDKKESYKDTNHYNYNKHIKGYFKDANIALLTYKELEEFRDTLPKKKLANSSINKQMILLKKILDVAVKRGFIKENPCIHLKKLKEDKKRMEYWTAEEFQYFLSLFEPDEYPYELFCKIAFSTGMRQGEILGLTWEDIDLRKGTIDINKTLVDLSYRTVINEPKTKAGTREVTIQSKLAEDLADWKNRQKNLLSPFTTDVNKLQVLQFVPDLMDRHKVSKKFKKVISRSDTLKRIRVHDLRHSHAALLIHNQEAPYIIKERMGHSTIKTTYDTYGHLYPNAQKTVSDKLENLY